MLEMIRIQSEKSKKELMNKAKQKGFSHMAIKIVTDHQEMANPENDYEIAYKEFNDTGEEPADLKKHFTECGYEIIKL